MRKTNDAGVHLIKSFEGLRLKAYRDSVNVLTIGYGHTGSDVIVGEVITEPEAEGLLRIDLKEAEVGVASALTRDVTDNQFAACVSLAFNVGVGAFEKSSIARYLNENRPREAAGSFLLYDKAGGKRLEGLTRRRRAERALFLTEDKTEEVAETVDAPPAVPVTVVQQTTSVLPTEKIKEIAGTGLSTIGNKLATGGISSGLIASIGAFAQRAWPMLIFAGVLLVLGVIIWLAVYHNKHQEKQLAAKINADPGLHDVVFK
jgi:lysozyme